MGKEGFGNFFRGNPLFLAFGRIRRLPRNRRRLQGGFRHPRAAPGRGSGSGGNLPGILPTHRGSEIDPARPHRPGDHFPPKCYPPHFGPGGSGVVFPAILPQHPSVCGAGGTRRKRPLLFIRTGGPRTRKACELVSRARGVEYSPSVTNPPALSGSGTRFDSAPGRRVYMKTE